MTAFTGNGYLVTDIASLTAIPAIDRPAFKVALLVAGLGWYEYDNAATTGGIVPNDNPVNGRWFSIGREVLRANRTYFVRTDGSDSNTGLTNTSGGAFLTIQKAIDVVASLDISIYDVTIQVADGTYNEALVLKAPIGSGSLTLQGNLSNTNSVIVSSGASVALVAASKNINWIVNKITFTTTSFASILVTSGATLNLVDCACGGATIYQIGVTSLSILNIQTRITFNTGSIFAIYVDNARMIAASIDFTFNNSPAFSPLIYGILLSVINIEVATQSGAFTGDTYALFSNTVLNRFNSGLPNTGTITTGAQVIT